MSGLHRLNPTEKALLEGHNFAFSPLLKRKSLDLRQVTGFTVKVALVFMIELTVLSWPIRLTNETLSLAIAAMAGVAMLIQPFAAIVSMMHIFCLPKHPHKEPGWRGHVYWMYWPFWFFVFTIGALICGVMLGEYIWNDLYRYHKLTELRHYKGLNPQKTTGQQIEDAGVVTFSAGTGIERGHGGCFVNGDTYCVAPIALDKEVGDNVESGTHDFFAVGVNCCDCPSTSFRCGDWSSPYANGGLRSVDVLSRAYYKLAVQEWSARTNIEAKSPLFFRWTTDPEHEYKMLYARPMHIYFLAMVGAPPIICCAGLLLIIWLQTLTHNELASKDGHPPQPSHKTVRKFLKHLHPELHHHLEHHNDKYETKGRYDSI